MGAIYDEIGVGYAELRRPDPRIGRQIQRALGEPRSLLNVGAGTGSYEPRPAEGGSAAGPMEVVAVEPSREMIRQRSPQAAPVVQASATALPFDDASFEASLAILTVHHWPDQTQGLTEMRRTTRGRVVILTWDPDRKSFWLDDYFPEIRELDAPVSTRFADLRDALGPIETVDVPVPHDCTDGFLGCYWRRPEAYLNERVRGAISTFSKMSHTGSGLARLRDDLASGEWDRRYGHLRSQEELDIGYRLVIAG
ncbi:MAG: class I SAM-dependent methyltransferase [Myxococcota bacterium]|nr:class I SAM-dependent methyltransferase [Myxococcota bacterium]